jgi:hypothetical protein
MPGKFLVTLFTDVHARALEERFLSLDDLSALMSSAHADIKQWLPLLKLARFGSVPTTKGSLRHDRNLIAVTGVELDYDGGQIQFDAAADRLEQQGVAALIYTSPSHAPTAPRWRALAPLSMERGPDQRAAMLGRLNGLLGGLAAPESWTLSQAFYYGHVGSGFDARVIDGLPIDQHDDLDLIWQGPVGTSTGNGTADRVGTREIRTDVELIRLVLTGAEYHRPLTALAARYTGRDLNPRNVQSILEGLMLACPEERQDQRWQARLAELPAIVSSASRKFFVPERARDSIEEFARRMTVQGKPLSDIQIGIHTLADQHGISRDAAWSCAQQYINRQE